MSKKSITPSTTETAFDCPYCGALTTQYWMGVAVYSLDGGRGLPRIPDESFKQKILRNNDLDEKQKKEYYDFIDKCITRNIFISEIDEKMCGDVLGNFHISRCYNCKKMSLWVHEKLVYPLQKTGATPNQDLPEDILSDFEEARDILYNSPRGAAALLRLVIQKLCIHLGEKGKSIDDDIASLVGKGLNPMVQKALDVVRVIGNEAVHPGTIDLKDDSDTARKLLDVINIIAEQMITHPKSIQSLYDMIPESKKQAIEARNEKATGNNS